MRRIARSKAESFSKQLTTARTLSVEPEITETERENILQFVETEETHVGILHVHRSFNDSNL